MKEKELTIKSYKELLEKKRNQNKPYSLKSVHKHVNFASRKFSTIWSNWWGGETPPSMEVDLVLIFEDIKRAHDEALIVGVEAEYVETLKKNFFVGIDQIIAFSLFGFDGLCFWHCFSEEIPDEGIESYVNAVKEIFGGFDLPIFYLATKIKPENKFECFAPMRLRGNQEIDYLIDWLRNYCDEHRNPILKSTIVKNRRKTLKTLFRLPV